jgi:hypothetical protein
MTLLRDLKDIAAIGIPADSTENREKADPMEKAEQTRRNSPTTTTIGNLVIGTPCHTSSLVGRRQDERVPRHWGRRPYRAEVAGV